MINVQKDFVENLFSIKGKTALVTGATGALGGAIAVAYAMSGAKVVITGRNDKKLADVAEQIKKEGGDCAVVSGDPAKNDDVAKIIQFAVDTYGSLDILAVAHGYNKPQNMLEQSVEDWQYIMDADLKRVYVVCKAASPQMADQGKGACDLMIQSMACDLSAKYKINVNSINPTVFRSDLTEWMFDPESAVYQNFLKRLPIGRLGEPYDFVGLAIMLASPASDFLTGGNYDATGGYWAC